jgi:2-polyprenyl-6-hydroxyphenyl methylase/3-demethylubiquinone-9 3-methyltransferase
VAEFRYPVGDEVLRSVEEFRDRFGDHYLDEVNLPPRVHAALHLAATHAPATPRAALDYGAGAGPFAHHLARRLPDWDVEGWDGDPSAHEIATACFGRDNLRFRHRPYDAYEQLDEARYGVITFLEVIEHVDAPGPVLRSLRRALAPGGVVVLSTPSSVGWSSLRAEAARLGRRALGRSRDEVVSRLNGAPLDPTTDRGHLAMYSLSTLSTLLRSTGFELVAYDYAPLSMRWHHRLVPETLLVAARRPR